MDDDVERVYEALMRRELPEAELSARRLASFLGKTTGALYHRYGSLDGFLFAVSQRGFQALKERVEAIYGRSGSAAEIAALFVDFGLDYPELYRLMLERRFDWSALRAAGAFERSVPGAELWDAMICVLRAGGSKDPEIDGRLLWAGLHGLVSLAQSGRANVRALDQSDRDVARAAARELARRLVRGTGARASAPQSRGGGAPPEEKGT